LWTHFRYMFDIEYLSDWRLAKTDSAALGQFSMFSDIVGSSSYCETRIHRLETKFRPFYGTSLADVFMRTRL
jgi:hypothetical protein